MLGLDLGLNVRWTRTTSAPLSTLRPLVLEDSVLVGNDAGELLAFRQDKSMGYLLAGRCAIFRSSLL